jgi:hypothetical protein
MARVMAADRVLDVPLDVDAALAMGGEQLMEVAQDMAQEVGQDIVREEVAEELSTSLPNIPSEKGTLSSDRVPFFFIGG